MVRASYLQIYMETINDLLRPDRVNLNIREDKKKGFYVDGLSEWVVRTPKDIYNLIQRGTSSRAKAFTKANEISSRSHAVFIIVVEQLKLLEDLPPDENGDLSKQMIYGKLNLVDLAGSERLKVTGATGQRLEECKKINQSLSCLGNTISALVDNKPGSYIPYRDSKLTRLLEDSLGGNCKTTMMGMISPIFESFSESLSTLKFANRAKRIKNRPTINEDVDSKAMLSRYEKEISKLREELDQRNRHLVDQGKFIQLEEEKKRLEEDRVAALEALEEQSKDFLKEREEKKRLEQMIKQLESSVVFGGNTNSGSQGNYDKRFSELEVERQKLEEDRAQVDQYKQLLLKQRDIMIALTTRLNERDETIVQLQEELDAYDRIHYEAEEMLEIKKTHIEQLENLLRRNGISVPSLDYKSKSPGYSTKKLSIGGSSPEVDELKKKLDEHKETISRLQKEIKTKEVRPKDSMDVTSLQNEFQDKINKINSKYQKEQKELTIKLKVSEDNGRQMADLLQEISRKESGKTIDSGIINLIKGKFDMTVEKVDNLVNRLSQQSDPQKLHSVVLELFSLQKVVRDLSVATQPISLHSASFPHSQKVIHYEEKDSKDTLSSKSGMFNSNLSSSPSSNDKGYSLSKYQRRPKM